MSVFRVYVEEIGAGPDVFVLYYLLFCFNTFTSVDIFGFISSFFNYNLRELNLRIMIIEKDNAN